MQVLYQDIAKYYDKIFYWKDYKKEVDFIESFFRKYNLDGKEILDVACGTGSHANEFGKRGYDVTCLDLSEKMLKLAKKKIKNTKFYKADMKNFNLNQRFDAITCLFGSINYNLSSKELESTLGNFYNHLKTKGVCIFDVWLTKESFRNNKTLDGYSDSQLKIARFMNSFIYGNKGKVISTYLVKDNRKISFFEDEHMFGLFSNNEIIKLMRKVGFKSENIQYKPQKFDKKLPKVDFFFGIKS